MISAAAPVHSERDAARGWRRAAVLCAAMAVVGFYLWTVRSTGATLAMSGSKSDYYNLLVDGFQEGHLYMKGDPDPRLLALPPEQRPGNAPFKLDASLYGGHYYLYFGVTPVMLLYLPYSLLTGHDMSEAVAGVIFMSIGFAFATAWWLDLRRRFFPRLGMGWTVLCVLALGFCTAAPSALRRPLFYEVAIGAGYAFSMAALWATTRAWRRPRQSHGWLALAGVAVGLAVGSRANLAPAGLVLLCAGAVGVAWRNERSERWRRLALALLAAGGGAASIGAGLATYNYARFGSVTEFGHHYQLGTNPKQMFRWENLRHNFALYYLKPPAVNAYFPFVAPPEEGEKPSDYVGREHVHGEWIWSVLTVMGVIGGATLLRRRGRRALPVLGLAAILFLVNGLVVGLTGVRSNRYMVDFHPALVLLTLAMLALGLAEAGRRKRFLAVGVAVGLPLAILFNLLASFQVHGFFRASRPETFARLAAVFDTAVWPWWRSESTRVGDREVVVRWPTGIKDGRREPLLSAGTKDFRDAVWVNYDGQKRARFVFQHGEYGDVTGEWFPYESGARVTLRVSGGLLLPGAWHPWYGKREPEQREALKRRLRISVNGELRFDRDVVSYDSSPRLQRWGEWGRGDDKLELFSGQIEQVTPVALDERWVQERAVARGAIKLKITLPPNRFGTIEPLVQSGDVKTFDMIAVRYVTPGIVQLLHDHLGAGGRWSEEFAASYDQPQMLEISLPGASDGDIWSAVEGSDTATASHRLRVVWNGKDVFSPAFSLPTARPLKIALGTNALNSSSVSQLFAGSMVELPRLKWLGPLRSGRLMGMLTADDVRLNDRGIWMRFDRAEDATAALVWRREQETGSVRAGWVEGGKVSWLTEVKADEISTLRAQLLIPELTGEGQRGPVWIELEAGSRAVFAHQTEFFKTGTPEILGLQGVQWMERKNSGDGAGSAGVETGPPLPGRLRIRFKLPPPGSPGGEPLLSAGKAGAADSIFLRAVGEGRYVVGLDHWGLGAVESAPIALAADEVQTLLIELGSLFGGGEIPRDRVRLTLNGETILNATQALYPTRREELVIGKNPLGMSTSGPEFRGEIVSVSEQAGADDVR